MSAEYVALDLACRGWSHLTDAAQIGCQLRLCADATGSSAPSLPEFALGGLAPAGRFGPFALLVWILGAAFDLLLDLTGGAVGSAIVLLSLSVKAVCHPISRVADRWQKQVDCIRVRLEPDLQRVRQRYRGEERSRRMFEVYSAHGVHPLFGLKSLLGLAVQIPFFLAAYHMLDEHSALAGSSFLWIQDLSRPDRVAGLPFAVPWMGDGLNLLPLIMGVATALASRLHDDGLPGPMLRSRRRGLYAMALLFFLVFYTFPAGVVLYWTSNTLVSLLNACVKKWLQLRSWGPQEVGDGTRA